jgi:hypothetical protein
MQRIIGRIEVENDLPRCALMRLYEQVDQKILDGHRIVADLVVSRRRKLAQLQLARQHRHHRIMAQLIVVVEILVAERDPEHPLTHQGRHTVLDQLRTPLIVKARRKPIHQINRPIGRAQKQRSRIRRHQPAVECRFRRATFHGSKIK